MIDQSCKTGSVLVLALMLGGAAHATSIAAIPPHDPRTALPDIERLIAAIDSNKVETLEKAGVLPFIYTDALGMVEYQDRAAFLRSMNSSDGRDDRAPIKIVQFRVLVKDKIRPVYVVTLERQVWKLKDHEPTNMLIEVEVDRPHYESEWTTWLVAFRGFQIASFRQADELSIAATE